MTPADLLAALRARGATLALAPGPGGPRLEFDAPADVLTPGVRALLAEHKPGLVALLLAEVDRGTAELRASIPPPPWPDGWQERWADRLDALADAGTPWPEAVWGALADVLPRSRGPPLRGPRPATRSNDPATPRRPRTRGRSEPRGPEGSDDRSPDQEAIRCDLCEASAPMTSCWWVGSRSAG